MQLKDGRVAAAVAWKQMGEMTHLPWATAGFPTCRKDDIRFTAQMFSTNAVYYVAAASLGIFNNYCAGLVSLMLIRRCAL